MARAQAPQPENPGSFDEFWKQNEPKITGVMRRIQKTDAEDVVQHVAEQVFRNWTNPDWDPDPKLRLGRAIKIGKNKAYSNWTQKHTRRNILARAEGDRPIGHEGMGPSVERNEEDLATTSQNLPIARPAANPEDSVILQEEADTALESLLSMVPDGKEVIIKVFLLHKVEGYSHKEIAEILGIAPGTSRNFMTKANQLIDGFKAGQDDEDA